MPQAQAEWRRVRTIFEEALAQPPENRASFVDEACGRDAALREQVLALLASHERAADFLETPVARLLRDPARANLAGQRIGPYALESRIGQGGMGDVYRARDMRLNRVVAIKVLAPHVADRSARERFEREARAVAALTHPHICTLYDVGSHDGLDYLVMEYLEGETLATRLQRGPLATDEAVTCAAQIASALDRAHRTGVVHRDLKPSNIVMTEGGAKLLDFGIAKLHEPDSEPAGGVPEPHAATATSRRGLLGTIAYMSPEQVRGEPVDARSDLFSFGALIYEMTKGRRPFAGGTTEELCAAIVRGGSAIVNRLDERDRLDAIIAKALQPDVATRYQTAAAMTADLQRLQHSRHRVDRRWRFAAASAAVLALLLALVLLVPRVPRDPAAAAGVRAVAVLPFKPLVPSGEDNEYLGVALADALITELGAVDTVAVRPLSGSARFRGAGVDAVAAGRELDAELVVDGAIQRVGERLRVTVHVVRVADGVTVWSERFDTRWTDVFSVQDTIAEQVASALAVPLTGEDRRRVRRRRTENFDAYEAYLKGRYFWNSRTADGLHRALGYFEQAIRADPRYAAAHAGLADTYALLGSMATAAMPPSEAGPKAIRAAAEALALDDSLAEAHASYAFAMYSFEWNWSRAEDYFRRAIALDDDYAAAHYWYSLYLGQLGRFDEALVEARRAMELEPLALVGTYAVGFVHYSERRFDLAREYAGRVLEVTADSPLGLRLLGSTLLAAGQPHEAVPVFERLAHAAPNNSLYAGWLAHAYGRSGNVAKARETLARLTTSSAPQYVSPANVAIGYIGLGESDAALEWLERAYAEHSQALTYLKVDPVYDPLRADARFVDLVRRVGFTK